MSILLYTKLWNMSMSNWWSLLVELSSSLATVDIFHAWKKDFVNSGNCLIVGMAMLKRSRLWSERDRAKIQREIPFVFEIMTSFLTQCRWAEDNLYAKSELVSPYTCLWRTGTGYSIYGILHQHSIAQVTKINSSRLCGCIVVIFFFIIYQLSTYFACACRCSLLVNDSHLPVLMSMYRRHAVAGSTSATPES